MQLKKAYAAITKNMKESWTALNGLTATGQSQRDRHRQWVLHRSKDDDYSVYRSSEESPEKVDAYTEFLCQYQSNLYWQMMRATNDKIFFNTQGTGHIGVGPPVLQRDDQLVILLNGEMSFAIRPTSHGHHKLLGEVHVLGIMHGEFMNGEPAIRNFLIE